MFVDESLPLSYRQSVEPPLVIVPLAPKAVLSVCVDDSVVVPVVATVMAALPLRTLLSTYPAPIP